MKKKLLFKIAVCILTLTILPGCGKDTEKDNGNAAADNEEKKTITVSTKDANGDKETSEVAEVAAGVDEDATAEKIVKGSGYFVQCGDKVYFHVPDESAMETTSLNMNFARQYMGSAQLYCADVNTGTATLVDTDEGYGEMTISGNFLCFANGDDDPDSGRSGLRYVSLTDYSTGTPFENCDYLCGDEDGHFAIGYKTLYDYDDGESHGTDIYPIKDGETLKPLHTEDIISDYNCAGMCGDVIVYTTDVFENYDYVESHLKQINIVSGDVTDLGTIPKFEGSTYSGSVDYSYFDNGKVYITYSDFEGTGHFLAESYLLCATIDKADSLTCEDGVLGHDEYDEPFNKPFYVEAGTVTECDGKPETAGIIDDEIGYFDEKGSFVRVSSGFGTYFNDNADSVNSYEQTELVGDYIYTVHNVSLHVPEEDVGWRYAYKRTLTEIIRVNISTGEKQVLISKSTY